LLDQIGRVAEAGVDFIQIREKQLTARDQLQLARAALTIARSHRTRILLNDRFDIALAAGVNGVHLPAAGLSISAVRQCAPTGFLIGRSCHSVEEVERATAERADYCLLGPIFETPSKLGMGRPLGPAVFKRLRDNTIPVLAIGSITLEGARECVAQGAAGIAAIRLFQGQELTQKINRLRG
jgi:thiamine-phosphate pyrophosphorylase